MGEVYRARDTKLARDVAIKVLSSFSDLSPDRRKRFEREALALASLNHPHIATVYGLEDAGGQPAIAMELVDGPSLSECIADGQLDMDRALRIAREIAEGLHAAHLRGIVHRDLKPQNIKLTPSGSVKLLDFGLAKTTDREAPPAAVSDGVTMTSPEVTAVGTLLGTAAYMAPEQARGLAVDHHADIWAFGCVLFEMLSRRRPFSGGGPADVLAAILQTEPDWTLLPSGTPPGVRRLLKRCLEKAVDRRLDSARDAILEIDDALDPAVQQDPQRRAPPRRWNTALPWLAAAMCLAALAIVLTRPRASGPPVLSKLAIALRYPVVETGRPVLAVSPDGSRLAFVAQHGDGTAIYLRPIDSFESVLLPGTEGASFVGFSPDGEWVVFFAERRLRKVSTRGGPSVVLAAPPDFMGATWSPHGTIIFSTAGADLLSVPEGGGEPTSILSAAERADTQISRELPHLLPGGAAVLFTVKKPHEEGSLAVRNLRTGQERILVAAATHGSYVDETLLFARSDTLFAVKFDVQSLTVAGDPVPVLQGVGFVRSFGTTNYAVSPAGRLAYVAGPAAAGRQLATVDRAGKMSVVSGVRHAYFMPRVAPTGERLALTILADGIYGIWTTETLSGRPTQIAENGRAAVWSPDGKSLAFTRMTEDGIHLDVMRADGSARTTIVADKTNKVPTSWTPDGRSILFTRVDPDGVMGEDIYIAAADGSGMRPLLATPKNESAAVVSRDGKWLAFTTSAGAVTGSVAVAPLSDPSRASRVDADPAMMPVWSPAGDELLFLAGVQRTLLTSVTVVDDGGVARLGKPRLVAEQQMGGSIGFGLPRYDVLADGQRFVFATAEDSAPRNEIRIILDWTAQQRKLLTR
jgi:Tol biopolymer transport system component